MNKLQPSHLGRKTVLYIRQSSNYQVRHYTESRSLQYQMRRRSEDLGFSEIDVVDDDQGQTTSGHVERIGFDRMVADVCMDSRLRGRCCGRRRSNWRRASDKALGSVE